MDLVDIAVLLVFAAIAALGVSSNSRGNTSADWASRIGMIGVAAWLCWIFLRPGGESARGMLQMVEKFFSQ
ncbi:MAG TPA: hypothetical protein VKT29_10005 [Terriglobales bacterium]|nr:hypothetical protein [Terriglobales bacterium]